VLFLDRVLRNGLEKPEKKKYSELFAASAERCTDEFSNVSISEMTHIYGELSRTRVTLFYLE
jgi:hypothetical protein